MKYSGLLFYLAGVMVALVVIAWKEKRRLKGTLFSHMLSDIYENPLPALSGYLLKFAFSWVTVLAEIFIKDIPTEPDGTVKKKI